MFQLSIKNDNGFWQSIGEPMKWENGKQWQDAICKQFPTEMVKLEKVVAQYVVPVFTVSNDQPALVYIGKEAA
jgi:hypothetical protein